MYARTCTSAGSRALVGALVLVIALAGTAGAAPVSFQHSSVAGTPADEVSPTIDGHVIAWVNGTLGDPDTFDIAFRDLKTGLNTVLARDGAEAAFDVAGDRIAFEARWGGWTDIWMYEVDSGNAWGLAHSDNEEVGPRLDERIAVWWDATTGHLRYRDFFSGTSADVPEATGVTYYDVDNGRIVWVNGSAPVRRVYSYRPGVAGATVQPIFNVPDATSVESLQVHGDRVILSLMGGDFADVLVVDLQSRLPIMSPYLEEDNRQTHGAIFWDGYVWDEQLLTTTNVYFAHGSDVSAVANLPTTGERKPTIFGRRVVYELDAGANGKDVWMAWAPPATDRTSGDDRYATAIEVSTRYFSRASAAVLCTGLNFPDALAATPLSRALEGPLLLTRPDAVDAATLAELDRLQVETVYIIGGTAAVEDSVETQLNALGYEIERIAGEDRYATSAEIARVLRPLYTHRAVPAFFTRGDDFPDALSVGAIAANAHAPILLVASDAVPAAVVDYIVDFDIVWGVVVGGPSVVTQDAVDALNALMIANGGGGPEVGDPIERWSGDDRYETATVVVDEALTAGWMDLDTLGIATGLNFPDALGGGAALGYAGCPLLLARPDSVPPAVEAFLASHEYEIGRLDVFGGSDVVSDDVKNAIAAKLK